MGKTGKYIYDPVTKEMVKVSDKARVKDHVFMPRDHIHSGAHFENLGDKTFYTANEKRQYMKEKGIAEL